MGEVLAQMEAEDRQVETRSYTTYKNFLYALNLKSGPPRIATYAEWAKMEAE